MPQLNTPKQRPKRNFIPRLGPDLKCGCPQFVSWKSNQKHAILLNCPHIIDMIRNEEEGPLGANGLEVALLRFDERQRAALLCPDSETLPALMVVNVHLSMPDEDGFMQVCLGHIQEGVEGYTVGYTKADTKRLELGSMVGPYLVAMGADTKCPNCDEVPIYESNITGLAYRAAFIKMKRFCPDCYDDTVPF